MQWVTCLHSCSVESLTDLTRSLDGVVDEESAEETDGDEEVAEDGVEENILGPEEADTSSNQEIEGQSSICW